MIEIKNLQKKYGSFTALNDVSLKVKEGEVFTLLGSNGAGKTTMIKIITGLLRPDSGVALIDGKKMDGNTEIKRRFGYMPEQPHLYERLTGREFLELRGKIQNVDNETLEERIDSITKELEIDHMLDSETGAYSKGMKQKILFTNAVLHDPQNFILDEPITGLDPRFTRIIKNRIKQMGEDGKTVLMSTHITSVAEVVCDVVGIINEGVIKAVGDIDKLKKKTNSDSLEEIFIKVVEDEK